MGNQSGLGRLARIYLLALARTAADSEIHVMFKHPGDLQALAGECDRRSTDDIEKLIPHYPCLPGMNRLLIEELELPRQFGRLKLDAYLGCDFTLPAQPVAQREAVVLPDLLPLTRPGSVSWRARFLYRRGIRRSMQRMATVLCISEYTRKALLQLFPDSTNARLVYPALSPKLWHLASRQTTGDHPLQVRGSLHNVSSPGPYILSVGDAGPRKNLDLLAEVYTEVVMRGDYRGSLIIVGGKGAYHTAPRQHPRMLAVEMAGVNPAVRQVSAEVHDIGRVTDYELSRLYREADLLMSLSAEEGFGFPVLEALAHGTPALVTRESSMGEIAAGGIATTGLQQDRCVESLASAVGALEILRREATRIPLEKYSIERLGRELVLALSGDGS